MNEQGEAALALMPELAGALPPRRRPWHWAGMATAMLVTVTLLGVVFGGAWWYHGWAASVGRQAAVGSQSLSAIELARYRAAAHQTRLTPAGSGAAPVVLTYHDVRPGLGSDPLALTPAAFTAQMAMLHAAGFHSLSGAEIADYVHGRATPQPRSVLITFDDAGRGLYVHADPVLARYGLRAVAFLSTSRVDDHRSQALTWAQIQRLARSGRWTFAAQAHDLYGRSSASAASTPVSALLTPTTSAGQSEPLAAFATRVHQDLLRCLAAFADHGLRRPTLFAWPYADVLGPEGRRPAGRVARQEVARLFGTTFVDVGPDAGPALRLSSPARPGQLEPPVPRLPVPASAAALFTRLQALQTLPIPTQDLLTSPGPWQARGIGPAHLLVRRGAGAPGAVLRAPSGTYLAFDWAPARTSSWAGYTAQVDVDALPPTRGSSAGLRVRVGGPDEVVVQASRHQVSVHQGKRLVLSALLPDQRAGHRFVLQVRARATVVSMDGRVLAWVTTPSGAPGSGGVGLVATRRSAGRPFATFTRLLVRPNLAR